MQACGKRATETLKRFPNVGCQRVEPLGFILVCESESPGYFELSLRFSQAAERDHDVMQVALRAVLMPFADV
jgi:hypothetical protein